MTFVSYTVITTHCVALFQLHVSEYLPSSPSPDVDVSYVISSALKYSVLELTDLHGWTVVRRGCSAECGTGGEHAVISHCCLFYLD